MLYQYITALLELLGYTFLPSGVVVGKNVSVIMVSTPAPSNSQSPIPDAFPAAFAAPSAVILGTVDLTKNIIKYEYW
jgi:hypothetical protein